MSRVFFALYVVPGILLRRKEYRMSELSYRIRLLTPGGKEEKPNDKTYVASIGIHTYLQGFSANRLYSGGWYQCLTFPSKETVEMAVDLIEKLNLLDKELELRIVQRRSE
jgi:hypothetical protein